MKPPRIYAIGISLLALAALTVALTSCAGLTLRAATPFGDISTTDGHSTITLRPIIIPEK